MADSTSVSGGAKEKKIAKFPLSRHARGYWSKVVGGRFLYFERIVDDPDGSKSLKQWLLQEDDLRAGKISRPKKEGDDLRLAELCNHFLTHKKTRKDSGEIGQRMFDEYFACCDIVISTIGKNRSVSDMGSEDFEKLRKYLANRFSPTSLKIWITKIKSLFRWAYDAELIDRPIRYGTSFDAPSAKTIRKARAEKGELLYEASEIRSLIEASNPSMKAMILLGIQAGIGGEDLAQLELPLEIDKNGWMYLPRRKTGMPRRFKLWAETKAAIEAAIGVRKSGKAFIGRTGRDYLRHTKSKDKDGNVTTKIDGNRVSNEFDKTAKRAEVRSTGFYSLRRTFFTIAEPFDRIAAEYSMGYAPKSNDMPSVYRQRIDSERLEKLSDHMHRWLYGN